MTVSKSNNVLPAAVQTYSAALVKPAKSPYRTASAVSRPSGARPAAMADVAPTVDYVYNGLTATDLAYDTSQYPVSGTYTGITPPWLDNINAVPTTWQWSQEDNDNSAARGAQVTSAMTYINQNVPGQKYTGTTTAQIIQQWYTQGMWDPSVFPQAQADTLTRNWIADDAEFARQRLGGANPNVLQLASGSTYNVAQWISSATNASALGALLGTLQKAQAQNELFVCDYTAVLGPVVTNKFVQNGQFFAAPICYFTVDTTKNTLVPQAIQITATDKTSYIFTPNDPNDKNGDAWLLAKLWVASADQQWWFSGSHLFNTHSVDMIFGIAALKEIQAGALASNHPMVILAQPYLVKSFSINSAVISAPASGQAGIYQKSTTSTPNFCDAVLPTGRIGLYQIITDLYRSYSFDANAFSAQMASRGLQSGAIAKVAFPYRDDGQVWWNALQTFVGQIVGATYANDAAVAADAGLNAWMNAAEVAWNHDGTKRFTWTPTVAYLKSAFTNLLFVCSAQHTAVNDTMFPGWAFTPNGAFAMQAAPPTNAASVTQQTVTGSLPNPQDSNALVNVIESQITFVMNGTSIVTEVLAGSQSGGPSSLDSVYPYASGSAQQTAVHSFWNAIWTGTGSVNTLITSNQEARVKSWTGATPVPNSLAYYYLSPGLTPWAAPQYLNAPAMNAIQI